MRDQAASPHKETERQKMLAGELYDPMDTELAAARERARDLCQALNATGEAAGRTEAHPMRAIWCQRDTEWMQPPFLCNYGSNIELGEWVFFNLNCVVLDVCSIKIGSFTLFGPAVQIYPPMHPFNAELRRRQEFGKPVEIGFDVWVGGARDHPTGRAYQIERRLGAGSVVTRDVPERVFCCGHSCRLVRDITE